MITCFVAALVALASVPACGTCGSEPAALGFATVSWSVSTHDHVATCAQVGAASVSLQLHSRARVADVVAAFPCTDGEGTTSPITAGPYEATLTLRAADGTTLATAPPQTAVTIAAGQVTALAPAAFVASNHAGLTISLSALATSTNCMAREQGGAGLTGTAIELEHAGGGCAPVTFTRSRGTTPLGTYRVICSTPSVTSCIERDERLTVDSIEPGPYTIRVFGLTGPAQCWSGADALSIPAGAALDRRIQLAQNPGC